MILLSLLPLLAVGTLVWGYVYVTQRYWPSFQVEQNEKHNIELAANPVIVLFDGVCAVCDIFVGFCVDRDPFCRVVFASLNSPEGQALFAQYNIPAGTDSMVAIHNGTAVLRSTAALQVVMSLSSPIAYVAAALLVLFPPAIRDLGYKLFARVRYTLFGHVAEQQGPQCRRMTGSLRRHFLTGSVLVDGARSPLHILSHRLAASAAAATAAGRAGVNDAAAAAAASAASAVVAAAAAYAAVTPATNPGAAGGDPADAVPDAGAGGGLLSEEARAENEAVGDEAGPRERAGVRAGAAP